MHRPSRTAEFIRQQWRMWIKTDKLGMLAWALDNSFASNGECGLKQVQVHLLGKFRENSFASNGECGLKLTSQPRRHQQAANSFASNGECGLKRLGAAAYAQLTDEFIRQQWRMWIETS